MSERDFYTPIPDEVRMSPSGCPVVKKIPAPYSPVLPWNQPLSEQPKGRLHKSKRNMVSYRLIAQVQAGEDEIQPREFLKDAFGRNGLQEPFTLVRFK